MSIIFYHGEGGIAMINEGLAGEFSRGSGTYFSSCGNRYKDMLTTGPISGLGLRMAEVDRQCRT